MECGIILSAKYHRTAAELGERRQFASSLFFPLPVRWVAAVVRDVWQLDELPLNSHEHMAKTLEVMTEG